MDLDVTLKSLTLSKEILRNIINEVISIPTHELVTMKLVEVENIHEGADYPGFRVAIKVYFDGIKETIKIDFTTGDILTPDDIRMNYQTLLESKILKLRSYNIETILAEKLETILSRGILNTRMRDYYDVYILTKTKSEEINQSILKIALINTMKARKTYEKIEGNIESVLYTIKEDTELERLWLNYQKAYSYANDINWKTVINTMVNILDDIDLFNDFAIKPS